MRLVQCLKLILSGAIIIYLTGCENNIGGSNTNNKKNLFQTKKLKNINQDNYMLRMGDAYDSSSDTGTSGQSCLKASEDNNNLIIANPEAIITFEQQQGFSSLQNNLGVNVNGSYGGDRFNLSASAMFAKASQDNSYTTNIVYLYKYSGKSIFKQGSIRRGEDALVDDIKPLVHKDIIFRNICGDSFVEQMDAGALLGVRLTLAFNSHMDKQKFSANMAAKVGLADVAAAIQQAATNSDVHINFSLSAIQKGGQPQNLNDIFGKVDESGDYPFVKCGSISGTDPNGCKKTINAIIDYSKSMKEQLSNPDGSLKFDNLYYSNPTTKKYADIGIEVGAPDPSEELFAAMESLTTAYDKAVYDRTFISHYRDILLDKMDNDTNESMKHAEEQLINQLDRVYLSPTYKLFSCYRGYISENCLKIKNNVERAIKKFALEDNEKELINYLETNSYATNLYQYYHESEDVNEYYKISPNICFLAPVSAPIVADYVLNCNGRWIDTASKPINIMEKSFGSKGSVLEVKNLKYYSKNGAINPIKEDISTRIITYPSAVLSKNAFYPNAYSIDSLIITSSLKPNAQESEVTTEGILHLTRLYENQI